MAEPGSRTLYTTSSGSGLGRSGNGSPEGNGRARASLLVGLLAAAALPVTIAVAQATDLLELLDASGAIPVAAALGVLAIALARSARRRAELTLGRIGGERAARAGRVLGVLAMCLAIAGVIAIAFYFVLQSYE